MHPRSVPSRRPAVLAGLLVVIGLLLPQAAGAASYPTSMASTGDSITRAFNTCSFPYIDCPQNSWSTGTSSTVNSIYLRLLALNPAISGHNSNRAVSGARMADLAGQMANVNAIGGVQLVTIEMGGNDLCTDTTAQMTSVADYTAQLSSGLATLRSVNPGALVYIVSVPDVYNLWVILHDNSSARSTWTSFNVCQSLLANPTSTAQADVDRRQAVRQRNIDLNTALAQVCAQDDVQYECRTDANAVFNTPFVASEVSTRDYFHPNVSGQQHLAAVAWAAGPYASVTVGMHIADLDGASTRTKSGWRATVTLTARTESQTLLAGATVSGGWSNGNSGSCTTSTSGTCQVSTTFGRKRTTATWTVSTMTEAGYTYQPGANSDPDGDSNGTAITVARP
ncbi:MAG: SGNH/GDSL hydrolase family protein [Chloroflexi bacterium]|nr:MAG: SGNH/GDSL hydrolase family protein [Chloroflexota bacterium]